MNNYPPGVTGNEPQITGYTNEGLPPEDCERCVCAQDGYFQELDEFLCMECLCLLLKSQIETEIGERTDDVCKIEKAFEDAMPRTDEDNVYTSIDFDVDEVSYSVNIDSLFAQKINQGEK